MYRGQLRIRTPPHYVQFQPYQPTDVTLAFNNDMTIATSPSLGRRRISESSQKGNLPLALVACPAKSIAQPYLPAQYALAMLLNLNFIAFL